MNEILHIIRSRYELREVENKEMDGQTDVYLLERCENNCHPEFEARIASFYGPYGRSRAEDYKYRMMGD